jgi:anti-anti-sigma factor
MQVPSKVPSNRFLVRVQRSNGISRLRLAGRFDAEAVRELDRLIDETERYDVLMDLRNVTYIDVDAWLAVMNFEHRAQDRGKELRLVNTPSSIRRVFELTATDHLLSETERDSSGRSFPTGRRHEARR